MWIHPLRWKVKPEVISGIMGDISIFDTGLDTHGFFFSSFKSCFGYKWQYFCSVYAPTIHFINSLTCLTQPYLSCLTLPLKTGILSSVYPWFWLHWLMYFVCAVCEHSQSPAARDNPASPHQAPLSSCHHAGIYGSCFTLVVRRKSLEFLRNVFKSHHKFSFCRR